MVVAVVEDSPEVEAVLLQEGEEVSEEEVHQEEAEDFPHEVVVVEASEAEEEDSSFFSSYSISFISTCSPLYYQMRLCFPTLSTLV